MKAPYFYISIDVNIFRQWEASTPSQTNFHHIVFIQQKFQRNSMISSLTKLGKERIHHQSLTKMVWSLYTLPVDLVYRIISMILL